jgi:hypothetical protein
MYKSDEPIYLLVSEGSFMGKFCNFEVDTSVKWAPGLRINCRRYYWGTRATSIVLEMVQLHRAPTVGVILDLYIIDFRLRHRRCHSGDWQTV